jgi:Ca2+-binding EF-hand superfamily protein
MKLKLTKTRSRLFACSLSLLLAPFAWANNPDEKFAKMDTDGNGQISREEHAAGTERMFAEIDTNGDGVVTATEMDTKLYQDKSSREMGRAEMSGRDKIKTVDQNSDGRLTRAEHTQGSEKMFGKMDTNQDGSLSREELEAGHKMKMKDKTRS